MKKFLINIFALIGFVTFILLACSVDDIDSNDNNNNNNNNNNNENEIVSNDYGKYQIASTAQNNVLVLNTETGVMKAYYLNTADNWTEYGNPITFTH
jgi:hypothetical protein